jgi:fucose permease
MASPSRLIRTPALWVLYSLIALYSFFLTGIGPAVPFLRAEFHFDYTMAALHVSAFAVGMILAGATAAAVMRRLGVHASIWGGQVGLAAGMAALILAPVPWVSLTGIFVAGLTGTLSLAAVQAAIAVQAGPHRGKALLEANIAASLTSSAAPFVLVLGTVVGLGWRALGPAFFLGLAAAAVLGIRPIARSVPDRPVEAHSTQGRLPRSFLRAWLLIFVGVGVEWCLGFWAASYLKGLPGGSDSLAVAGAGAFQLAAVAGRLLSSRLTGRFGEKRILAFAIAAAAVGFPLYWSLAGAWISIGGLMLCGMAVANFYPLGLSLAIGTAGPQAAKASSLATTGSGAAVLVAPLALGAIADSWGLALALFAIPFGLVLMLILLLARRKG